MPTRRSTRNSGVGTPGNRPAETEPPVDQIQRLAEILRESMARTPESRWRPHQAPKATPKFGGDMHEAPERFLRRLESYYAEMRIPEAEFTEYVGDHLTLQAAKWFQPLAHMDMPWSTFRRRFCEHFAGTEARVKLHIALLTERQGANEPGRDFVARKMTLAQRTLDNINDHLPATMSLLTAEYRFQLVAKDITSFDQLLDFVTQLDETQRGKQSSYTAANRTSQSQAQTPRTETKRPYPCRFCHGDHWASDCPTNKRSAPPRADTRTERQAPKCRLCPGTHWHKDCPEQARQDRRSFGTVHGSPRTETAPRSQDSRQTKNE